MFCVIYEFKIKADQKDFFLKAWSDFTKAIQRVNGSLGSRIHSTKDSKVYIAYAQWPSEDSFNNAASTDSYTQKEQDARKQMSDSTTEVRVLHKLNLIEDLLVK